MICYMFITFTFVSYPKNPFDITVCFWSSCSVSGFVMFVCYQKDFLVHHGLSDLSLTILSLLCRTFIVSTQVSAERLTQAITGHRGLSARDNHDGGGKAPTHPFSLAWRRVYGATRRVLYACMWHRWTCCVKEWIIKRPRADYIGTWNLPQKPCVVTKHHLLIHVGAGPIQLVYGSPL